MSPVISTSKSLALPSTDRPCSFMSPSPTGGYSVTVMSPTVVSVVRRTHTTWMPRRSASSSRRSRTPYSSSISGRYRVSAFIRVSSVYSPLVWSAWKWVTTTAFRRCRPMAES